MNLNDEALKFTFGHTWTYKSYNILQSNPAFTPQSATWPEVSQDMAGLGEIMPVEPHVRQADCPQCRSGFKYNKSNLLVNQ